MWILMELFVDYAESVKKLDSKTAPNTKALMEEAVLHVDMMLQATSIYPNDSRELVNLTITVIKTKNVLFLSLVTTGNP
jgi:hypothetical protein